MSFVFPALLAAGVLAGIPVLLHLILRQKPKPLPFPAFRFLVAKHQTNQRKLQLRHWLLLALRMLLIAGIVVALARPRLLESRLGLSRERPVAAVFVIDVSASMEAISSDKHSRLVDAKKRAIELLDQLPPGSRIAVLSSSDVRGDWITNPFQARQRINHLKVDYASPPLPRGVITGLKLLADIANKREDEAGTRLSRLLCVFSDTTRGAWTGTMTPEVFKAGDDVPTPKEALDEARADIVALLPLVKDSSILRDRLSALRDEIPKMSAGDFPLRDRPLQLLQHARATVREYLKVTSSEGDEKLASGLRTLLGHLAGFQTMWFDVGLDPPRDLAILDLDWPLTGVGVPRETVGADEKILFRPVLQALGQDFQAAIACGPLKETREVVRGSRISVPMEIDVKATKPDTAFHSLEFAFVKFNDVLAVNNQRFATLAVATPRKALVVSDTAKAGDDFPRVLAAHDIRVEVKPPSEIESGIPAGYDAVFLLAVPDPSDAVWKALASFARAGGGVGILPGADEMKPAAYQSAAARELLPGVYDRVVRIGKEGDVGTLWQWHPGVFRYPLLQPFERWIADEQVDFTSSPRRVWAFWNVVPADESFVKIRYMETAQNRAQSPAVLERPIGAGKVVQFTTPLDIRTPAWNNYLETGVSFYVVLNGLMVKHLTGELEPVRINFLLGREEASLPTRFLAGRGGLSLRGPESGPVAIDAKSPRVAFPLATSPGNFQVVDTNKTVVAAFSMNLPSDEIDLTPLAAAEIENVLGANVRVAADRQADLKQLLQGRLSEPVELFPILMVALLLMLAVENLLSNRFYRSERGSGV
jgi:hypothetical protein